MASGPFLRVLRGPGRSGPASFRESLRIVRSNVDAALASGAPDPVTVVVAGVEPGCGATVIAVNLAAAFAATGRRTTLADLDLRDPAAHGLLAASNETGATDVLRGAKPLDQCLQRVTTASGAALSFLAAGPAAPDPGGLLAGPASDRLLLDLSQTAEVLVVDSPAVLAAADALELGLRATGTLLVAEARRTGAGSLRSAKEALDRVDAALLGVVLNKSSRRDGDRSRLA